MSLPSIPSGELYPYKKLFEMDNIALSFEEDALDFIVQKAVEYKLGARGLLMVSFSKDLKSKCNKNPSVCLNSKP